MIFKNIICDGELFGDQQDEVLEDAYKDKVHFQDSRFRYKKNTTQLNEALKLITLCHDIYVEDNDGKKIYNSSSPDEIALINFAKMEGRELLGTTNNIISVS